MPHVLLPTSGRYRISNDVLIMILEKFDPHSLYRTCKVFKRVRDLVFQFHQLRYKCELALSGMSDGVLASYIRPRMMRLPVLLAYRNEWPVLNWTAEKRIQIPASINLRSVSGDFMIYGASDAIQLQELPSIRLNRPPSQTRHLQYGTAPQADVVAVDPSQALVITGHAIAGAPGQVRFRLKLRNVWTFDKHPDASMHTYECRIPGNVNPIKKMSIAISGLKLVVSLELVDGALKQLLLDWNTFRAQWLEDHDLHFLSTRHLLGVKIYHGRPVVQLYNMDQLSTSRIAIEREYELPAHWANAELKFMPNTGLARDAKPSPNALFFSDPLVRVLVIMAKQAGDPMGPAQWLMIKESYFTPSNRPDRLLVPWTQTASFCLVKTMPAFPVVRNPQLIGNRIVYLESDSAAHGGRGYANRIGLIEFPSFPEQHPTSVRGDWTHKGERSVLRPYEFCKDIPSNITRGAGIDALAVTEDNIVLFLEARHGMKETYLMSFGVPA